MSIVVFVVVFVALFGPKLAGNIDISVLGGAFGFLLLLTSKKIRFSREYTIIVILVAAVLAYSMLAVLFTGVADTQPVLRHFRALISTVLLGVFFYNLAITGTYSSAQLIRALISVLLINAIVVLLSILLPEIKPPLAKLYGFDKAFRGLRSFGLTAGYDTAGYLCVFGAALSAIAIYYKRSIGYSISLLSFLAAAMFTSRSSIVLTFVLMTLVCGTFLLKGRWTLRVASMSYLAIGAVVAFSYVIPLFLVTFGWGVGGENSENFTGSFATTDLSDWQAAMWTMPNDPIPLLFGTGEVIDTSDVGYVKLISMIGIVGLSMVMSIYAYMFLSAMTLRRSVARGNWTLDLEGRALLVFLLAVLASMYVINIKNLYFLTRGYHEFIVILFFFLVGLRGWTGGRCRA